jgi:hypothetical protein
MLQSCNHDISMYKLMILLKTVFQDYCCLSGEFSLLIGGYIHNLRHKILTAFDLVDHQWKLVIC